MNTCCYVYGGSNSSLSSGRSGGCPTLKLLSFVVGPKKCDGICTYIATNMGNVGSMENSDDPSFDTYSASKGYVDQGPKGLLYWISITGQPSVSPIGPIIFKFVKGRNYRIAAQLQYEASASQTVTLNVTETPSVTAPFPFTASKSSPSGNLDQVLIDNIFIGDDSTRNISINWDSIPNSPVLTFQIYDVGSNTVV